MKWSGNRYGKLVSVERRVVSFLVTVSCLTGIRWEMGGNCFVCTLFIRLVPRVMRAMCDSSDLEIARPSPCFLSRTCEPHRYPLQLRICSENRYNTDIPDSATYFNALSQTL